MSMKVNTCDDYLKQMSIGGRGTARCLIYY